MLETIDFTQKDISKEDFKPRYNELSDKLVVLQQKARTQGVGIVVLFEGVVGSGRSAYISDLMYKLDARATSVYFTNPSDITDWSVYDYTENGMLGFNPLMKEYWRNLGQRDEFTFFDGGWYSRAMSTSLQLYDEIELLQGVGNQSKKKTRKLRAKASKVMLKSITYASSEFERQLINDGYLVVKFYNHISYKGLKKNIRKMAKDPSSSWMVEDYPLGDEDIYEKGQDFLDELISKTSYDFCPWVVLNGENPRESKLTVVTTLVNALEQALTAKAEGQKPTEEAVGAPKASRFDIVAGYPQVDTIDHSLTMTREEYKAQLKPLQKRLNALQYEALRRGIPVIATFEGWDAAGKGGAIKRVAQALDARLYTIFPSPAPTKMELGHPHLWRYWTRLPYGGCFGLYDRTWYGRVLVERIEGFAKPERWAQAYDEINAFELDLVSWGAVLVKFWVDISPDEQLKRFEARQADPDKQWKITEEDWRNREKYPQYKEAVDDMFRLTSTTYAPWTVLESECKYYARIKALRTIVEALEERLAR